MRHTSDSPHHNAKRQIAEETGEITKLWNVGPEKRDAFIKVFKIGDWKNPTCTPENLGLKGDTAARLTQILHINRSPLVTSATDPSQRSPSDPDHLPLTTYHLPTLPHHPPVSPQKITWNREHWAEPEPVEFFVDFETCSDLDDDFETLPTKGGQPLIFMIGCGHIENGEWKFECFIADRLAPECELQILEAWTTHMDQVQTRLRVSGPNTSIPQHPNTEISQSSLFDEDHALDQTRNAESNASEIPDECASTKSGHLTPNPVHPNAESNASEIPDECASTTSGRPTPNAERPPRVFHWSPAENQPS